MSDFSGNSECKTCASFKLKRLILPNIPVGSYLQRKSKQICINKRIFDFYTCVNWSFQKWIFIDNGVVNGLLFAHTYTFCNSPRSQNEVKQKWFQMDLKSMTALNTSIILILSTSDNSCSICLPQHAQFVFAHCVQFIQQKYRKNEERKKAMKEFTFVVV